MIYIILFQHVCNVFIWWFGWSRKLTQPLAVVQTTWVHCGTQNNNRWNVDETVLLWQAFLSNPPVDDKAGPCMHSWVMYLYYTYHMSAVSHTMWTPLFSIFFRAVCPIYCYNSVIVRWWYERHSIKILVLLSFIECIAIQRNMWIFLKNVINNYFSIICFINLCTVSWLLVLQSSK